MSRDQLLALGGGALCAVLSLSVLTGAPVFALLSQLPLLMVGLGLGLVPATTACVTAAVILAAATSVTVGGYFVLATAVPVLIVVNRALVSRVLPDGSTEWYPTGNILSWITAMGLAFLMILYVSGTEGELRAAVQRSIKALLGGTALPYTPDQIDALARTVARYAAAARVTQWTLVLVVNAVLAQKLLVRMGRNRRPPTRLIDLELPRWLSIAVAVAAGASLVPGQIGMIAQNGLMILAIPFFFLGLAVIHAVSHRWQGRGFVLFLLYLVLVVLQWPAIVLAGLGFVEQWARLRRRFGAPQRDRGEE